MIISEYLHNFMHYTRGLLPMKREAKHREWKMRMDIVGILFWSCQIKIHRGGDFPAFYPFFSNSQFLSVFFFGKYLPYEISFILAKKKIYSVNLNLNSNDCYQPGPKLILVSFALPAVHYCWPFLVVALGHAHCIWPKLARNASA